MDDLIKFNKTFPLKDRRGTKDFGKIALFKARYSQ